MMSYQKDLLTLPDILCGSSWNPWERLC